MLQLNNNTPFAANMALFPDPQGVESLFLLVRASFNIGPRWTLTDEQPEPVEADVYWGEPERSSLKFASDYHVGKLATDVVMIGQACAPGGQSVTQLDVSLSLGPVAKTIRVFGDRSWQDGMITSPQPFQTMPMVYEKSFGGVHLVDGRVESAESRNPIGCGYAGSRQPREMDGVPLPNLEDPRNLIRQVSDCPTPVGFGFCSPAWMPRAGYAGSYDQAWRKRRAPYLPEDFDRRFLNMAHPDLVCQGYLRGGEPGSINGMHPEGEIKFNLPRVDLNAELHWASRADRLDFRLETVLLEPNQYRLGMIWKAACPCDKRAHKIRRVDVGLRH